MTHKELLDRIAIDPAVCSGRPCVRGHRIWVSLVLDFLASGLSTEEILEEYPQLTAEDVRACVAYASRTASWPGRNSRRRDSIPIFSGKVT